MELREISFQVGQLVLIGSWVLMFLFLAATVFHRSMILMLAGVIVGVSAIFSSMNVVGFELLRLVPMAVTTYFIVRMISRR